MATLNYFINIRSLVCQDASNGLYQIKYVLMNRSTVATATSFWHEGLSNATPLAALPADVDIPTMAIEGKSVDQLSEAVRAKAQNLATRLTQKETVPIAVAAGTIISVTIET